VLKVLLSISEAAKVSTSFLTAFETLGILAEDGTTRIHGNYNMTGTVSGRLSSNNPNLQNLNWRVTY